MKRIRLKETVIIYFSLIIYFSIPCYSQDKSENNLWNSNVGEKNIDLDIQNMDVESVLKVISDTGGWTIVPSKKVTGKVSLWSKGATATQLLDKLCLVNDYIYKKDGNIIYLMSNEEYEQLFGQNSKAFLLKHQKVESIEPLLKNSLTKTGKLAADPWSNTIIVSDTFENMKKINSLISDLDQGFVQRSFQLTNARAEDVAKKLGEIFPKEGPFQADARTNSIVVFNSKINVERMEKIISEFDRELVTKIFQIRFQKASELSTQISNFLRSFNNDSKATSTRSENQFIVSDATNQIVVTGDTLTVNYISRLIEELDSKVLTVTIPLKHLKAFQVLPHITQLASNPESIKADSQGNNIIIQDSSNRVEQIRKVILELDDNLVTEVFTLKYAIAEDIERALKSLVTNPDSFQIESRTNQIVICDSKVQVERIGKIISDLDKEDAYFTRTYHLTNTPASHVAEIIQVFIANQNRQQTYPNVFAANQEMPDRTDNTQSPSNSSPAMNPEIGRSGLSLGSSPGLAGTQKAKPSAMVASTPLSPPPLSPGFLKTVPNSKSAEIGMNDKASESIGVAGTVVADDRSNTIIVTETLAILSKVEQLIKELDIPTCSYVYKVKYRKLNSMELDKKLSDLLKSQEDSISLDEQTRTVQITTIPSNWERIIKLLEQWDKPPKQALIRAKIIAISSSALKDIGVQFESLFDISGMDIIFKGSLPSSVTDDHSGSFKISKLTGTQYQALIRAIESNSKSRILANPRILAVDGQAAEVSMATDEPFKETSIDAQNGKTIENTRFLKVGTVLQVTPTINEDDTVEMNIAMDVSSLVEIRNGVPVVNHNIAASTVIVKNNNILMIGGLKFKRTIEGNEKIPVLGNIPLVGVLFNSQRDELANNELVLLLQPTIISSSDGLEDKEISETAKSLITEFDSKINDCNKAASK